MRTLVLGTAGHIDHGKSALVLALSGIDPDRLKEEKARGITIELGFAHTQIDDVAVALVDVPGHERFVRTMLAGAGGLDAVLLIIAADESVMPQTREHLEICRLLAIPRGLIVITKSDLVDDDTRALVALEARALVAGSPLESAPIVTVSAHTGDGIDDLRRAIRGLADGPARPARSGATRVPIDRAFIVKGFGTVVTGTLVSGTIAQDQALVVLPSRTPVRVRGVQVHGQSVAGAAAPRRVAVNLGGVDLSQVARGMTLATPGALAVTRRVDVRVELVRDAPPLRHGSRIRVHQGTSDRLARVSLAAVRQASTDVWTPVVAGARDVVVPPGGEALARLRLATPMVVTRSDRIVLRATSPARTVGGALVLDPEPPRGGVRRPATLARLQTLVSADVATSAELWLTESGLRGVVAADLVRRGGVAPDDADAVLRGLMDRGPAVACAGGFVGATHLAAAATALLESLRAFHRDRPGEEGVPRETLRDRVAPGAAPAVFDAIVARASGVTGTDRLRLSTHQPVVRADDARAREAVGRVLREAGVQPPDLATLAAAAGVPPADVPRVLRTLVRERVVVKLDPLWFHVEPLQTLKSEVRALGTGTTFDVAAAKARFGVTRKFAIPLLEYLDRERVTRRIGDTRVVI